MVRKVLITDISSYKAICLARFIKQYYKDIKVLTCDHRLITKRFHTKYSDEHFLIPESIKTNKISYINSIAELMHHHEVTWVFPVNSTEIRLFLKNKKLFSTSFSYYGDQKSFDILDSKDLLYDFCIEHCIPTPRNFSTGAWGDFPLVVKPTNLSSSKGVRYFKDRKKLEKHLQELGNEKFIVQEYIEGYGCGYSVFAKNGEVLMGHGHFRLAEFPSSGGSSVYREDFYHPEMIAITKKLVKLLNWSGFAMFEFKVTKNNKVYLIEVNPRIWGSINQGLINGTNYLEGLLGKIELQKGEKKTYLSPLIYLSFIQYACKLNFKPLLNFIKNIHANQVDVHFLKDPFGYISVLAR